MTDGVMLSISGWFTPYGELYHEERRLIDEIPAEDWAGLLAHADRIDFFTRPEPEGPPPESRIFHLTITSGERSRELAINDPFDAPELAKLVTLTRVCLRDRQVMRTVDMSAEVMALIAQAPL